MDFVSIIIPTRNEESFIDNCLKSVLINDYCMDYIEILILDGMSRDHTLEIVNSYISEYPNIKVISNSGKIYPCAINLGVKKSKGDVILILGAHATYKSDYISKCVKYLIELDADNVGGVLKTVGLNTSIIGKAITIVLTSPFGVGNSTFRTGSDKIVEVDTVFGGCYKRNVFDRIGFFNENLISSSDMDFNTRLKKSGGKIYLVPEIIVTYYTRSAFMKFFINNIRNGYWAIYPMRFLDYIPVSLRHFIPLLFMIGVLGGILLSQVSILVFYLFVAVLSIYFVAALLASAKYFKKSIVNVFLLPFLFVVLHLSYGFGSLIALIKVLFSKR